MTFAARALPSTAMHPIRDARVAASGVDHVGLALELLYTVAGIGKLAISSSCGEPYLRACRAPKRG